MDFVEGEVIYVDKPLHLTSFKVVKIVRAKICHKLGIKKLKVGHAGTLDPLATGVMTICTGKMTKQIDKLQAETKEYIATIRLGATTPSFDLETEVDAEYPIGHITKELVQNVLKNFIGTIEQIPPDFSACKIDGRRAYDLARQNLEVNLKPNTLVIDEIELLSYDMHEIKIRVVCSKGTYIRALARDIGQALNSGGHLTGLIRSRVGDITLEDCLQMGEMDNFLDSHIQSTKQF